jgi:hypothetical protein
MIAMILWIVRLVPLPLLVLACFKPKPPFGVLVVLGLSAILLILIAISPTTKKDLMGANYSPQLHARIELNLIVVVTAGIYLAAKRQWLSAVAALIFLVEWLSAAVANVAV